MVPLCTRYDSLSLAGISLDCDLAQAPYRKELTVGDPMVDCEMLKTLESRHQAYGYCVGTAT